MPGVLAEVIRKGPMCDEKVTLAWRLAVGPQIAKVTTVRLVPDGTLHIKTDSQAWIDAVRKSTSLIQIRMGDLLGENLVKRLEFRYRCQGCQGARVPGCQGARWHFGTLAPESDKIVPLCEAHLSLVQHVLLLASFSAR